MATPPTPQQNPFPIGKIAQKRLQKALSNNDDANQTLSSFSSSHSLAKKLRLALHVPVNPMLQGYDANGYDVVLSSSATPSSADSAPNPFNHPIDPFSFLPPALHFLEVLGTVPPSSAAAADSTPFSSSSSSSSSDPSLVHEGGRRHSAHEVMKFALRDLIIKKIEEVTTDDLANKPSTSALSHSSTTAHTDFNAPTRATVPTLLLLIKRSYPYRHEETFKPVVINLIRKLVSIAFQSSSSPRTSATSFSSSSSESSSAPLTDHTHHSAASVDAPSSVYYATNPSLTHVFKSLGDEWLTYLRETSTSPPHSQPLNVPIVLSLPPSPIRGAVLLSNVPELFLKMFVEPNLESYCRALQRGHGWRNPLDAEKDPASDSWALDRGRVPLPLCLADGGSRKVVLKLRREAAPQQHQSDLAQPDAASEAPHHQTSAVVGGAPYISTLVQLIDGDRLLLEKVISFIMSKWAAVDVVKTPADSHVPAVGGLFAVGDVSTSDSSAVPSAPGQGFYATALFDLLQALPQSLIAACTTASTSAAPFPAAAGKSAAPTHSLFGGGQSTRCSIIDVVTLLATCVARGGFLDDEVASLVEKVDDLTRQQATRDGGVAAAKSEERPARGGPSPAVAAAVPAAPHLGAGKGDVEFVPPPSLLTDIYVELLKNMRAVDEKSIFLNPVTDAIAPNYSRVISKPVSISDIERRVKTDRSRLEHYKTLASFVADVRLMFENCTKYNAGEEGKWFRKESQRQSKAFDSLLKQAQEHVDAEAKRSKSKSIGTKVEARADGSGAGKSQAKQYVRFQMFDWPAAKGGAPSSTGGGAPRLNLVHMLSVIMSDPFVVRLLFDKVNSIIRKKGKGGSQAQKPAPPGAAVNSLKAVSAKGSSGADAQGAELPVDWVIPVTDSHAATTSQHRGGSSSENNILQSTMSLLLLSASSRDMINDVCADVVLNHKFVFGDACTSQVLRNAITTFCELCYRAELDRRGAKGGDLFFALKAFNSGGSDLQRAEPFEEDGGLGMDWGIGDSKGVGRYLVPAVSDLCVALLVPCLRMSSTASMRGTVTQFERIFNAIANVNGRSGTSQVYLSAGALSAVLTEMCLAARAGKMADKFVREKLEVLVFGGLNGGGGREVAERNHLAHIRFLEALGQSQSTTKEEVLAEVNVLAAKVKGVFGAGEFANIWSVPTDKSSAQLDIMIVYERIFRKFPHNVTENWKRSVGC